MSSFEGIERSTTGILESLLYMGNGAICIGVLLNSAVALSYIDDIDKEYISVNDNWEDSDHRRRYTEIAWYLWGVTIAGIAVEITMLLIRGQYLAGDCKGNFNIFAAISFASSVVLGFALIIGGFASAVNAVSVRKDYLDKLPCYNTDDNFPADKYPDVHDPQKLCDDLLNLLRCQITTAGLCFPGCGLFAVLTVIMVKSIVKKWRESTGYQRISL